MSTVNASLSDSIIAKRAIEAFTAELTALRAFSTDFSDETAAKGSTIQVAVPANITAGTTENAYETEDTAALGVVSVPLTSYAKATVGITDKQFMNSSAARLEAFAVQQAKAVARKIIADAWALIINATYSQKVTKALNSLTTADIRAMKVLLDKADVPRSDRNLILNPDAFDKVAGDTTITIANAMFYGGTEVVRDGVIPRLLGMDCHMSNIVPGNAENLIGFAVHPSALAIAIRTLKPQEPGEYLESRVITDEASGIGLGYRRHYSVAKGTHFCTFEAIYGAVAAVPAGLARLVTA
jgi:P22 coat protein - gene protein 5